MPGLGIWEIVFILVLALLIFGPKKLPEIGRTLGRGLGEFRRATTDLKRTFDSELQDIEREPPQARPSLAPAATVARPDPAEEAESGESESEGDSGDSAEAEPAAETAPSDEATSPEESS